MVFIKKGSQVIPIPLTKDKGIDNACIPLSAINEILGVE
jgi:hypothetical protein